MQRLSDEGGAGDLEGGYAVRLSGLGEYGHDDVLGVRGDPGLLVGREREGDGAGERGGEQEQHRGRQPLRDHGGEQGHRVQRVEPVKK
ncbi:hypothetical protein GCM10010121_010820 [Streptomyces brasiliensis]|uniref:Uncharacterized protein n=1 Tax=Streptomyces brasiliensis TaxID=1954 RepID=A0A917NI13_9ACTN|nr:hypothetical protein GCM10010121_010820 [Streptomyces brasiliensis]